MVLGKQAPDYAGFLPKNSQMVNFKKQNWELDMGLSIFYMRKDIKTNTEICNLAKFLEVSTNRKTKQPFLDSIKEY